MLNKDLCKFLTHSTMGLALLTTVNIALPSVSLAQKQPVKSTPSIATDYLLGGGDRIRVNVFEVPEYTGEYQVPPGGSINMPLIGSIPVSGLTTEQAADTIARRYARFLKRPLISVNLLSPRPINVFVAGEVTRPGAYTLSLEGGAGNNPGVQYPTVLAALTSAQGVTLAADVTQVQLRRKVGRSGEQTVSLNLKELTQTGRISQEITLRDGDTIIVPTAASLNVAEARNLFAANFAASQSSPRTVVVIGQVYRPGSYLVTAGNAGGAEGGGAGGGLPTVMRSLQLAGGITSIADVRKIKLRRPTRTGTEQTIDINLWELLQSGDINQDIVVQDGDTIIIPTATDISAAESTQLATTTLSPNTIEVGVVGEVKRAGAVRLQPNSSLNQALLAAGGFNDSRASKGTVELIRLNTNGTVTKRPIKVDLSKGINEETNPILRNNDVVVVDRNGLAKTGDRVNTVAGPLGTILGIIRLFTTGF
ncbi:MULTISPECIES: polysaccharide biosynthesis/export family protein [Nostocales]|jgi:polysaccharide export outer membrane protein|uniref:Polysaccharide biosynthesis/export family protein n=1 Tax=Aphanizomenon flos-aquae FACHB-1040 TaxID=2692887 RepID=A0ABR8BS33_APHFL|nr:MULTISPECIES: polysaccharide biosynthesis/export family protein [Nostocales]MBD2277748.1 polysaccharide biosynthesis/export family protein [Aphanizomenon flos-aquae FACHB-1040]MBO1071205.1 polysaccharide export protein [Dolichospermum sp. DEX189]MTJ30212.1 polysaccharide export protein [Aphanizomenon sp. UHCC 0183]OBQ19620.1 MAG: polysaccharide export protein [Anabaena sp. AL93]